MLDVAPTELLVVAVVAVVVIGPKDLPKAMRVVGYWVGKMRGVARQFRQGFDDMVREAEFAEMEKKWAEENARIMREFPNTDSFGADPPPAPALPPPAEDSASRDDAEAAMTVQPALFDRPAPAETPEAASPKPRKPRAAKPKTAAKPRTPRAKKASS